MNLPRILSDFPTLGQRLKEVFLAYVDELRQVLKRIRDLLERDASLICRPRPLRPTQGSNSSLVITFVDTYNFLRLTVKDQGNTFGVLRGHLLRGHGEETRQIKRATIKHKLIMFLAEVKKAEEEDSFKTAAVSLRKRVAKIARLS